MESPWCVVASDIELSWMLALPSGVVHLFSVLGTIFSVPYTIETSSCLFLIVASTHWYWVLHRTGLYVAHVASISSSSQIQAPYGRTILALCCVSWDLGVDSGHFDTYPFPHTACHHTLFLSTYSCWWLPRPNKLHFGSSNEWLINWNGCIQSTSWQPSLYLLEYRKGNIKKDR